MDEFETGARPEDRRDALRQCASDRSIGIETQDGAFHVGTVIDISRTGIRFRAGQCLPCGSSVRLRPPTGSDLPAVTALIVRLRLVDDAEGPLFDYGVRYAREVGRLRHAWFLHFRNAA